jgi:hypothetical protein
MNITSFDRRCTKVWVAIVLMAGLVGCNPPPAQRQARGEATEPLEVAQAPTKLPEPEEIRAFRTQLTETKAEREQAPAISPGLVVRIDASSPQRLQATLAMAEAEGLTPLEMDQLRAALVAGQMILTQKVGALAVSNGGQPPPLSDLQLFEMAFANIDGMTVSEVIAYGKSTLPTLMDTTNGTTTPPGLAQDQL